MSQEAKLLLLINDHHFVIHQESATEVIEFHLEDINLNLEHQQPDYRVNSLTEYFREQKNTNGGFKYFTLAAHYDQRSKEAVFIVQLKKELIERLCSALPLPFIVVSGTLESRPDPGNPDSMPKGFIKFVLNLQELITAETWRDNRDFHTATFSTTLISLAPNEVSKFQLALANHGFVRTIRPIQFGFTLASRPVVPRAVRHRATPTAAFGFRFRVRFNLSVGWLKPLKIKNIQISTQNFMEKLFQDEATKDLTIVAGNGAEMKCHRIIFSAHSPVFSRMLSSQNPMKEASSGRFKMSENSQVGVQILIKYLYGMPMVIKDMSVDVAIELFQTAHKYDLSHLEGALQRLFMKMEVSWFTPDAILELYSFVKKLDIWQDLREHCVGLMTSMDMEELRACEEFKKLESGESTDVLLEMVKWFKKRVPKSEECGMKRKVDLDSDSDTSDSDSDDSDDED